MPLAILKFLEMKKREYNERERKQEPQKKQRSKNSKKQKDPELDFLDDVLANIPKEEK